MKVTGALSILILFVVGFNPSNVYALFNGTPAYGNSSIFPYQGWALDIFINASVTSRRQKLEGRPVVLGVSK